MRSKIKREFMLTVRVTADEKKTIEANAHLHGYDTADYLRCLGLGKTIRPIKSKETWMVTDVKSELFESPSQSPAEALEDHPNRIDEHKIPRRKQS